MSLDTRITRLEQQVQEATPPEPTPVCISADPAEVEAFRRAHPGGIVITTRCARKCTEDCPDRGGHSCRQAKEAQ